MGSSQDLTLGTLKLLRTCVVQQCLFLSPLMLLISQEKESRDLTFPFRARQSPASSPAIHLIAACYFGAGPHVYKYARKKVIS